MVEAVAKLKEATLEPPADQVIRARENLTKVLQGKAAGKGNLYDHIVQVVDRIVMTCPDKAIERFEEVSYLIKHGDTLRLEEFLKTSIDTSYSCHDAQLAAGTEEVIKSLRALFATASPAAEAAEEGEGGGGATLGLVQDLPSLNRHVFNQAGVELGEFGSLILQKSLNQLAASTEAKALRFWGKILGSQKNYYIVEALEPKNLPEDTRPEGGEARGTGVNEYSYYVANQAQGPWELLGDLDP